MEEKYFDSQVTLSFSENSKGWVSFQSFIPESGVSINNEYYTFKDGEMYQHHSNVIRNNFYGEQFDSQITVLFNDDPSSVKSFTTINYEGSQARITKNISTTNIDGEYYNIESYDGWYVDNMHTNLQETENLEFKNKEGKWFSTIKGATTTLGNLDEKEFSVQGIGVPIKLSDQGDGGNSEVRCLTIEPIIDCGKILGCMDATALNYNPNATDDDGSCEYEPDPCGLTVEYQGDVEGTYADYHLTSSAYNSHQFQLKNGGDPMVYSGPYIMELLTITPDWDTIGGDAALAWRLGPGGTTSQYLPISGIRSTGLPYTTNDTAFGPMNMEPNNTISFGTYMGQPLLNMHNLFRINDVRPGTYYFRITDANGCVVDSSFTIDQPLGTPPDLCPKDINSSIPRYMHDDMMYGIADGGTLPGGANNLPINCLPHMWNGLSASGEDSWGNFGFEDNKVHYHITPAGGLQSVDVRDEHHWFWSYDTNYDLINPYVQFGNSSTGPSWHIYWGYQRMFGWQCHTSYVHSGTQLGEAIKTIINEGKYGLPDSVNPVTGAARNNQLSRVRSYIYGSSGNVGQYGKWTNATMQFFSYEDICLFVNELGLSFTNITITDPGLQTAVDFLSNCNTSTPWYGPPWISNVTGLPTNDIANVTGTTVPYSVEGILFFVFNGSHMNGQVGSYSKRVIWPVFESCDITWNHIGTWQGGDYNTGKHYQQEVLLQNCVTSL
jgi:hypothetical protein